MIVIGDSHVSMFTGLIGTTHIDKPTAHNIKKHYTAIKRALKEDEINLFIFGEIDCRIHFWYQACKCPDSPLEYMFARTAHRYASFISFLFPTHDIRVLEVPPAGEQGNYYGYKEYAPRSTRFWVTERFNTHLQSLCGHYKIPFIEYSKQFVDELNNRKKQFIADDAHLNTDAGKIILKGIGYDF